MFVCVNYFYFHFSFVRYERVEEGIRSNKLNCMFSGFSFQKSFNFSFFLTSVTEGVCLSYCYIFPLSVRESLLQNNFFTCIN